MTCVIHIPIGHNLESFLCSLEQEAAYLEPSCLDGDASDTSNSMSTASKCSGNELQTDCLTMLQSLETSGISIKEDTRKPTGDMLMLSPVASRSCVNPSAQPASSLGPTIHATCGPQLSQSSMQFDPDSATLKMWQLCLIADTSGPSSETWPRAGIVSDGKFFPQPNWERRISEIACGLLPTPVSIDAGSGLINRSDSPGAAQRPTLALMARKAMWPTPTARDFRSGHASEDTHAKNSRPLSEVVIKHETSRWPTPRASDYKGATSADAMDKAASRGFSPNLPESVAAGIGGQLNPAWVEWLMGWPPGWASLDPLSNVEEWINETATGEWWMHEHDLPRIAKGVPNRTKRLMAIGNGQVPRVVAAAWRLLTQDLEAIE